MYTESTSSSPSQFQNQFREPPRWLSVFVGTVLGLVAGLASSLFFSEALEGVPPRGYVFLFFTSTFLFAGFAVGLLKVLPPLIGCVTGLIVMVVFVMVLGPKNGWIGLWVFLFGGSGMVGGSCIGIAYWLIWSGLRRG